MDPKKTTRWQALSPQAQAALVERDYDPGSLGQRIAQTGIEAGQLTNADRAQPDIARA